jgi:hypothetical protein
MIKHKSKFLIIVLILISSYYIISIQATVHIPPKMVKSADDIVYEEGTTGHDLVWQFEAHESMDDPSTYDITVNGNTSVKNQVWKDNVNIVFNVDGFAIGRR